MKALYQLATSFLLCVATVKAQTPPSPRYDQVIKGKLGDGFQVSWKQNSVCETTPGVKSYSGYITTPPSQHSATTSNTFFWFFESRKDPANSPFVIWIGGGPGFNSMSSAVNEIGPCTVNADSNSTTLNPWSFNNEANIIFIDQPVQSGFSYDIIVNATVSQANASRVLATPLPPGSPLPQANDTLNVGAFSSQNLTGTSNSTQNAANIFWQDMQTWFDAFPQYLPKNNSVNLWTESYGGTYGPRFIRFFQTQNDLIKQGKLENARVIEFDTLGINNGWIDPISHINTFPEFAVNNTYGIELVNSTVADLMIANITGPGGCLDQVNQCRSLAATSDPDDAAANTTVDTICASAFGSCFTVQQLPILLSKRNDEDIAQSTLASVVKPYYNGFFAQAWVQEALGAAVNFTDNSAPVLAAFSNTGDLVRRGQLEDLGTLLDSGVYVALSYGDRDYQVNWFGGEAASLAIRWMASGTFAAAGYADLATNATYVGGRVRQAGRLSFSRVFQAGHAAATFQPETLFRIFQRTLAHLDVQAGQEVFDIHDGWTLATQGPSSVMDVRMPPPQPEVQFCYAISAPLTCTPDQMMLLASGKAIFKDYILQENSTMGGY